MAKKKHRNVIRKPKSYEYYPRAKADRPKWKEKRIRKGYGVPRR